MPVQRLEIEQLRLKHEEIFRLPHSGFRTLGLALA